MPSRRPAGCARTRKAGHLDPRSLYIPQNRFSLLMATDAQPAEKTRRSGLDLSEKGKDEEGRVIRLDRRLFVQLQAFTDCHDTAPLIEALEAHALPGVLYADTQDARGVGVLTFSEEADHFVGSWRQVLNTPPFRELTPRPAFTMFGRTYSIGYESDLEETLIRRPIRTMTNPAWPWAVWYPLRRAGAFEQLSASDQRTMLMEHGGIGRAYGRGDHAHDVRLSCHGLDTHDNDFIAGLIGKTLHPLSAVVQHMRKTKQTSMYLEQLGPFFVGKALWQHAPAS